MFLGVSGCSPEDLKKPSKALELPVTSIFKTQPTVGRLKYNIGAPGMFWCKISQFDLHFPTIYCPSIEWFNYDANKTRNLHICFPRPWASFPIPED